MLANLGGLAAILTNFFAMLRGKEIPRVRRWIPNPDLRIRFAWALMPCRSRWGCSGRRGFDFCLLLGGGGARYLSGLGGFQGCCGRHWDVLFCGGCCSGGGRGLHGVFGHSSAESWMGARHVGGCRRWGGSGCLFDGLSGGSLDSTFRTTIIKVEAFNTSQVIVGWERVLPSERCSLAT